MRIVVVAFAALLFGACRSGSGAVDGGIDGAAPRSIRVQDAAALESGAGLYLRYCASCHGTTARGDGPAAEALRRPPADLTRLAERYGQPLPMERLAVLIDGRAAIRAHGSSEMPVWGEKLYAGDRPDTPARDAARSGTIQLILEYLDTQQRPAGLPPGP